MAILAVESSTCSISNGASRIATIAPAIAVTRVNIAVIRPCRNPEMAAAITSSTHDDVDDRRSTGRSAPRAVRSSQPAGRSTFRSQGPAQPPSSSSDIDQAGGESPDQQVGHLERRTDVAARVRAPGRGWPGRPARRPAPWPPPRSPRGSTGRTSPGSRQYASTGLTRNPDGGRYSSGNNATGSTDDGHQPGLLVPPAARRSPRPRPDRARPPGNAGWPACERIVAARAVSSRSGPSGPVAEQHQHRPRGAPSAGRWPDQVVQPARQFPVVHVRDQRRIQAGSSLVADQPTAGARRFGRSGSGLVEVHQAPAPDSAGGLDRQPGASPARPATAGGRVPGRPPARPPPPDPSCPIPYGRAQRRQEAGTAGRPFRVTHPPAVEDRPVGEVRPLRRRQLGVQLELDLDRIGLLGQPPAPHQPAACGVDGDPRDAERVAQHHVRRLAAEPGQA